MISSNLVGRLTQIHFSSGQMFLGTGEVLPVPLDTVHILQISNEIF